MVKILVKQNNRNNSIHCNTKGARARSARAPLLFPSPLLFLLFCLTKILTKKLTWAGLGQALGWPRSSPELGQGQALGKIAPNFPKGFPGILSPKMLKNGPPLIFFGILESKSCPGSSLGRFWSLVGCWSSLAGLIRLGPGFSRFESRSSRFGHSDRCARGRPANGQPRRAMAKRRLR